MADSQERLKVARELIIKKKFIEARAILITMPNHPTAVEWLRKLDDIAPPIQPSRPARKNHRAALGLTMLLLLLVLVGGALLIKSFLSGDNNPQSSQIAAIPTLTPSLIFTRSVTVTNSPTQTPSMTPWPPTSTVQSQSAPTTRYYVTSPMANIRACASTSCEIVSQVQFRDAVRVVEQVSGDSLQGNAVWMHLALGDSDGYIHSSVLSETLPLLPTDTPIPLVRETATVTRIIDGDTIDVRMNGQIYRVRYIGINTPERDQACYGDATNANNRLVGGQTVTLVKDVSNTDQYGRLLRYVYVGNVFVNAELVAGGWAEARSYPPDTAQYHYLKGLESAARSANRGCHPTGVFN